MNKTTYLRIGDSSGCVICEFVILSAGRAMRGDLLMLLYLHALFSLCRPSSMDAIFLAHGLVVLQALPVSIANLLSINCDSFFF